MDVDGPGEDSTDSVPDSLGAGAVFAALSERMLGIERPLRVGRYTLQRRLGSGGMNTVWSAWDEELQRPVAIKFLQRFASGPDQEQRLQREAQALAQLSHPNVIPVYDVGRHQGRRWIAMEQVDGVNLRQWLGRGEVRRRSEILECFRAAGRGLAAIHAAGLVHRDVKPDNILLGDDGRVRVIDLGLVRSLQSTTAGGSEEHGATEDEGGASALRSGLTATDGFVGTPAYAAPEQLEGQADARADQYSFCVSLWEALVGSRPDPKRRADPELPSGVHLPPRLRSALVRGLSLDATQRFASMTELLAQLEPSPLRRAAPGLLVVAALAGVGGFVAGGGGGDEATVDPCAGADEAIELVWTEERRAAAHERLAADGLDSSFSLLEDWAQRWSDTAHAACEDVHVRHTLSAESLDRRHLCLERRLQGFEVVLDTVGDRAAGSPAALLVGLGELDDPQSCLGELVLSGELESPPAEHRLEIAELRRGLIAARAGIGEPSVARRTATAQAAVTRATEIGWDPLRGEAELVLGHLHALAGSADIARGHLGRALDVAEAHRDLELLADAWTAMNRVERVLEFDAERTGWALDRREALFRQFDPGPRRRARAVGHRGMWHQMEGRPEQAEASLREAIATFDELGPTAGWEATTFIRALGTVLRSQGRKEQARAQFERARSIEQGQALGVQPASVASSGALTSLQEGAGALGAGELRQAGERLREALRQAKLEQGERGEMVGRVHLVLAAVASAKGDLEALRHHAELADAIFVERLGPRHPFRSDSLSALAALAAREERNEAAVELCERSLFIASARYADDSVEVAEKEVNLAIALQSVGRLRRAAMLARSGLTTLEARLPADHPDLQLPRDTLQSIEERLERKEQTP